MYGTVERASLRYDISGRSLGEGEVQFEEEESAELAFNAYQGKPLDGNIRVEIYIVIFIFFI